MFAGIISHFWQSFISTYNALFFGEKMVINNIQKLMVCIVSHVGAGVFTRKELIDWVKKDFPEAVEYAKLAADYCVNRPSKGALPEFLYWVEEGKYRLFDPQRDSEEKLPKR